MRGIKKDDNWWNFPPASSPCRGLSSLREFHSRVGRSGCSSPGFSHFSRSTVAAVIVRIEIEIFQNKVMMVAKEGVNMEIAQ